MAPVIVTDDYYLILEVEQSAHLETIKQAYRRLALRLHPDRNRKPDAKEAFQLLGKAYETLKDDDLRREYDRRHPFICNARPTSKAQSPSSQANPSQTETLADAAQLAILQKSKEDRLARWKVKKGDLNLVFLKTQSDIQKLEQEIQNLHSISLAEQASDARKKSWGTWLLSPLVKKVVESEEEKERIQRDRQERRIEKDMKERRLALEKGKLLVEERKLQALEQGMEAANTAVDRKIAALQYKMWERENRERVERDRVVREKARVEQEKARMERERLAEMYRQQAEQRAKVARAAEELRMQQRAEREEVARRKAHEEFILRQKTLAAELEKAAGNARRQAKSSNAAREDCIHDGWWSKEQRRMACPECSGIWNYMLKCPGCGMLACPQCQSDIRPRGRRTTQNTARTRKPYRY